MWGRGGAGGGEYLQLFNGAIAFDVREDSMGSISCDQRLIVADG